MLAQQPGRLDGPGPETLHLTAHILNEVMKYFLPLAATKSAMSCHPGLLMTHASKRGLH